MAGKEMLVALRCSLDLVQIWSSYHLAEFFLGEIWMRVMMLLAVLPAVLLLVTLPAVLLLAAMRVMLLLALGAALSLVVRPAVL
jgi:hypothetical protein